MNRHGTSTARRPARALTRRLAAAAALVWVAGSSAGCTPTTDAPPTHQVSRAPTPSSSPSPTLTPAVSAPDKPPQWADTGEGGAAAAAEWFLSQEYRYVIETNDTTEWQRLSTDDCEFCANVVSYAASLAAESQHARIDQTIRVRPTEVDELNPLAYSVLTEVGSFTLDTFDSDGVVRVGELSAAGQLLVILHREGDDWVLREGEYFDPGVDVPSVEDLP